MARVSCLKYASGVDTSNIEGSPEEEFHTLFPYRLHQVLSQVEQQGKAHIVSWLPCGTIFKVHDAEAFTKEVMPKIGRFKRYKSFLRQLSMYKYDRIKSGPQRGAYRHIYFRRDHIDLCRGVLRGEIFYPRSKQAREQEKKSREMKTRESVAAQGFLGRGVCGGKAGVPPSLSIKFQPHCESSQTMILGGGNSNSLSNARSLRDTVLSFQSNALGSQPQIWTFHSLGRMTLENMARSFGDGIKAQPLMHLLGVPSHCAGSNVSPQPAYSNNGPEVAADDFPPTIPLETPMSRSNSDIMDEIIATFGDA